MNEIHPNFYVIMMSVRADAEERVERRAYDVTDHTSLWEVHTG
jgi:hypothetical protein